MNGGIARAGIFFLVAGLVILSQSAFRVLQIEQALIVQLGSPVRTITEPGLHFKIPFLQEVYTFENRLLVFDQDPQEVLSKDKKNLKVDNYARWRIVDPLKFYQTVRSQMGAKARLNDIIYSNLREVLGQHTMMEIVSGERDDLMSKILIQANVQAKTYGIQLVDVRIKRTDLPPENSKAVFRRMQTERERQAKQYRAEGEEEAVKIRAEADRKREILLANADRTARELRGGGDAESARIYAEAYGQDEEFFAFLRSMEAYSAGLTEQSTMLLDPNSAFMRFFNNPNAGR
ncbi:MAG: protease modulator HflC [Magnetococcales bacterium]|nr:protease modulator HflC [Magnetococcales bacterium]